MIWKIALLVLLIASPGASQEATGGKKPPLDEKRPVRFEGLSLLRQGEAEFAKVLHSSFMDVHPKNVDASQYQFIRALVLFSDGRKAAVYWELDFSDEKIARSKTLFVDVESGRWLLMRQEHPTLGAGVGAVRRWSLKEPREARRRATLVSFETRRVRTDPVPLPEVKPKELAEKLFAEELELRELLREVLSLNEKPGASSGRPEAMPSLWELAELLNLQDVVPCACEVTLLDKTIANDEPQPAPPLAPDLEGEFGKWASWRQLPSLRQP